MMSRFAMIRKFDKKNLMQLIFQMFQIPRNELHQLHMLKEAIEIPASSTVTRWYLIAVRIGLALGAPPKPHGFISCNSKQWSIRRLSHPSCRYRKETTN